MLNAKLLVLTVFLLAVGPNFVAGYAENGRSHLAVDRMPSSGKPQSATGLLVLRNVKETGFFGDLISRGKAWGRPKIQIDREQRRIILLGSDTDAKKEIIAELVNEFTQRTGRQVRTDGLDFSDGIDLTDILLRLSGAVPVFETYLVNGVNCHSTSLLAADNLKRTSHVDASEIELVLQDNCRKENVWQKEPSGTVSYRPQSRLVGYANRGTMFSHSFFVITPHVVLQKRSLEAKSNYSFVVVDQLPKVEYFSCKRDQTTCDDPDYLEARMRIDRVDQYFSRLMDNYESPIDRDKFYFEAQRLLDVTEVLSNSAACAKDVRRLQERVRSLVVIGDQLRGVGAILNTQSRNTSKL